MTDLRLLGARERALLGELAVVLLPGGSGLPSALEAGVASRWVDRVLDARPDLTEGLTMTLARAVELLDRLGPTDAVRSLIRTSPEAFRGLRYVIAAAYLVSPRVWRALGYPGPRRDVALADEAECYLEDGILERVIARGSLYRPTPSTECGT